MQDFLLCVSLFWERVGFFFLDVQGNSLNTPCNKYQIPGCFLAAGQAEGTSVMKAVHSGGVFTTCTGYSLSSSPCWDSFACPYCQLSVQPQPRPRVKHGDGQGRSRFEDGEITEDANNKQTDIEGDLNKEISLLWSSLGRYGNRGIQSCSWRGTGGSLPVMHWGQYRL